MMLAQPASPYFSTLFHKKGTPHRKVRNESLSERISKFRKGVTQKSWPRHWGTNTSRSGSRTVPALEPSDVLRNKPHISLSCTPNNEQRSSSDFSLFISPTSTLYDSCLNFITPEYKTKAVYEEFRNFKRSGFSIQLTLFIAFLNVVYFASRGSLVHLWDIRRLNSAFLSAFICGVVASISVIITLFNRLAVVSHTNGFRCLQRYHHNAVKRMKSSLSQLLEDTIIVFVALGQSLYLFGRIIQGQCRDKIDLFDTQECNPQAISNALPQDQLAYLFLGVLFVQVFLKGASKYAILLSWIINIITVNVSLSYVGSDQHLWLNISLLLALSLSYEIERSIMCLFIERKVCIKTKIKNHAAEIVVNKMADQRDVVNRINIELQGTIINSAHDMKSPCTGN